MSRSCLDSAENSLQIRLRWVFDLLRDYAMRRMVESKGEAMRLVVTAIAVLCIGCAGSSAANPRGSARARELHSMNGETQ